MNTTNSDSRIAASQSRLGRHARQASAALTLAAAMVGGTVPFASAAVSAEASKIALRPSLMDCYYVSQNSACTSPFSQLTDGQQVSMICWADDAVQFNGRYRSQHWFLIQTSDGRVGYTHSSYVDQQTSVVPCNSLRTERAVLWALARAGTTQYDGACLAFVQDAYQYGAGYSTFRTNTAWDKWNRFAANVKHYDQSPPRGAWVFWKPSAHVPAGHVALSLGGGRVVTTWEGVSHNIHANTVDGVTRGSGMAYAGWVMP